MKKISIFNETENSEFSLKYTIGDFAYLLF